METNLHLILHNIVSIISSLVLLGLSLFTFLNNKKNISNVTMSLAIFAIAVFTISHLVGVNINDPYLSKNILMFNLALFFIGSFLAHSIIYIINKEKENKWMIILLHSTAMFFTIFFIVNPNLFLLPSIPKMYFINYYVPGTLNWIRLVFLDVICIPYILLLLASTYKKSIPGIKKSQYKYLFVTVVVASVIGLLPNLLVYNVYFDPLIGMFFPILFVFPFIYGAVKYEMLDIKIIAKQAFFYTMGIIVVGVVIILLNYSNNLIINYFPYYPTWITAIISSILVVTISAIVWRNLRQGDLMKYEFITTVTHKFRTPLTGIKWATENLKELNLPLEAREQISYIKGASDKLVELTNLLVTTSETENNTYNYSLTKNDIKNIIEDVMQSISDQIQIKKLNITKNLEDGLFINCDLARIKFVIQTFIENAIHYTPQNGNVSIKLIKNDNEILFSVYDTGIGISKEEAPLVFSKFYRTSEARNADTEGMGIGLFIAKEIIVRHKGKIWTESDGLNKGSTFTFSLPLAK